MCDQEKAGLPLLPGLSFQDPTKTKFHRCQFFEFKQGDRAMKHYAPASGQYPRDIDSVRYLDIDIDSIVYDPSLNYGRTREHALPAFRPHYVVYDKKCLTFKAFFKQAVYNSPDEYYRVRPVNIIYFLDDDTITVMEPPIDNSGIVQGRLVRRGKVPKFGNENGIYLHWKDFNLGIDIQMGGIVYHIVDCDLYTKEFMLCQGIELNPSESMPVDPYIQMRAEKNRTPTRVTPIVDDRLRRFLEFDGRVLKFRAVWDDRDSEYGNMGSYVVKYYLQDDTVEVAEIHELNDGKDPFPLLLKRTKLPKNWKETPASYPSICLEKTDHEVTEYYTPKDFIIGNTIFIFGRRMLLHKCDDQTRSYYHRALNIKQTDNFEVVDKQKPKPLEPPPPHIGIGTLEDSLASCLSVIPKEPKKDVVKQIVNAGKCLRYAAKLKNTHPEDANRDFIISYSLADSTIKITELKVRNSGHVGGKFLADMLVPKPGSHPDYPEYYSPSDFYIGAIVTIFEHKFQITGADLQVYRYMEANSEKFRPEVIDSVRNYLMREGHLKDDIGTVAKSILKQEEYPPTKTCVSDPCATPKQLDPCCDELLRERDLEPDLDAAKELPKECFSCPPIECKNKNEPDLCKQDKIPEAYFDDLSGKMIFNRDNPKWK